MVILLSFLFSLFWCRRRGLGSRGMYGDGALLGVYDSRGLDMRLGLYLVDWGAFRGGARDRNP